MTYIFTIVFVVCFIAIVFLAVWALNAFTRCPKNCNGACNQGRAMCSCADDDKNSWGV